MSFTIPNTLILRNKTKQNANLQDHKQVIFVAAAGNSASNVACPANLSRSATQSGAIADTMNIIAV